MARGTSWNYEILIPSAGSGGTPSSQGGTVYPLEIGEFGEGEEGRIVVADGDRKYKIRDQIFDIGEIPVTILVRADYDQPGSEYQIMQDWCNSGSVKDGVYIIARGAGRDNVAPGRSQELRILCDQVQLAMGKHSAFNRGSKTVDTKQYYMIPETVSEVY
jgi:hypothetical protein